ncbi:MAG TPA: SDR family oxidoreductase [Xanthobacteraceae bacterium]|jgi:NAD(P)-dependent dehydrogenase (short-subunit alcohol dehydrogenase family)|nr:SDR family oxidoreductase [Xanthobacteraceae bacterium]
MALAGGRVVFLTGAAGGIGVSMTDALLAAGHCVAAVDRDVKALERLCARHARAKDRLHPILADLADAEGCERAIAAARARFGAIEAVINNAGIGMSSVRPDAEARAPGIEELTPEIWNGFMAIFVRAPLMLVRAALPDMKKRGVGRIVNNTTSYVTMLRVLPYGAAKAALESMSAVWAKELDGSGITVNVLIPGGPTDTPLIADESGWPRDKMLRPEIMGPPTAWLVSDEAKDFSGRRITAARWDNNLPPAEAAARVSRAIGWPELSADAVWLTGSKS